VWRGVWRSEADTQAFALRLAALPALRHAFIELHGELGAGKTTFVRHLLHALGVAGRIKSPTYAVVEPHELASADGILHIWHFDFYRFSDPREWEDAGFRDIFAGPGLKLAEWPEKAAGHLPLADLSLTIDTMGDDTRNISMTAQTETGLALLEGAAA
jgi:tRNA threonylcarbamoyladenosine biosynthesis protein TsaE